jgi:hypothetical protein
MSDVDDTLKAGKDAFPMEIEKRNWPTDFHHWIKNDPDLLEISILPGIKEMKKLITPI